MSSRQQHELPDISNVSLHAHTDIMYYTRGLQALLDVLPEDTDQYSQSTLDDYLWVIELLLSKINELLVESAITK